MGPLTPEELEDAVKRSQLAAKYNTTLDPQSAYEILGGKIAVAASPEHAQTISAPARRTFAPGAAPVSPELAGALGLGKESTGQPAEPPPAGVPYPKPAAPTPSHPSVIGEILGSTAARSVARSVAVAVAGTLTRSLLGAMGVSGRRR
jgi:hypothetical protein